MPSDDRNAARIASDSVFLPSIVPACDFVSPHGGIPPSRLKSTAAHQAKLVEQILAYAATSQSALNSLYTEAALGQMVQKG
jgi:hypothetical protein